ncbi:MAG: GNAT family N-acetyltransferase [Chloroflexi bacterium]|nr:GNAT family N-acetyltransferase [Chloroflexota bacterium]
MPATANSTEFSTSFALASGQEITIRAMRQGDGDLILGFAGALDDEDLMYLRLDISTPAGVREWLHDLDRGHTRSLVAFDGEHLIGYASVHRSPVQWTRRLGELRVTVHPRYRGRGLGAYLVNHILEIAQDLGLRKLTAQMTPSQEAARRMFERLGFSEAAVLPAWVEDRRGTPHDLVVLAREVLPTDRAAPLGWDAFARGLSADGRRVVHTILRASPGRPLRTAELARQAGLDAQALGEALRNVQSAWSKHTTQPNPFAGSWEAATREVVHAVPPDVVAHLTHLMAILDDEA